MMQVLSSLLSAGLAAGAPIALAALGGLFTEAAGTLSVALEGAMLAGAFAFVLTLKAGAGLALGIIAALAAGLLCGFLVGLVATRFRADVFVAGLAVNLLAPAMASLLSERLFGTKGVVSLGKSLLASSATGGLANLPLLGPALFGQNSFFYLVALAAGLLWIAYSATPYGLRLRAAGEGGEAVRAAGLNRENLRLGAHLLAGAAAALAGAALAAPIAAYVPGMSAGRGWIALVAIYLGGRRPGGVLAASLGFGLLLALSNAVQAIKGAPAELLLALPYLLTALALIVNRAAKRRSSFPLS